MPTTTSGVHGSQLHSPVQPRLLTMIAGFVSAMRVPLRYRRCNFSL